MTYGNSYNSEPPRSLTEEINYRFGQGLVDEIFPNDDVKFNRKLNRIKMQRLDKVVAKADADAVYEDKLQKEADYRSMIAINNQPFVRDEFNDWFASL